MPLALKARTIAHFGAQHCSSLCSQSEGREDESAATAEFVALFAIGSSPSLCEQSELQCWRANELPCLRRNVKIRRWHKGRGRCIAPIR